MDADISMVSGRREVVPNVKSPKSELFVVSRYLRVLNVTGKNTAFCYHSLFGNLHLVDHARLQVLNAFRSSSTSEDARKRLQEAESFFDLFNEFRDTYFLVPDEFDERTLVERDLARRADSVQQGRLISAVQLSVSEKCNLGCKYCFADRVDERADEASFNSRNSTPLMTVEVSTRTIDVVSDLVRSNGGNGLVVKFSGREPLLNLGVIRKTVDHCASAHPDMHYSYVITTNGTLLTPPIVEFLKKHGFTVTVSLDGLADGNTMRVTKSGAESFTLVDAGLKMLQQEQVPCSVASVLTDGNFDATGFEFIEYLNSRSVEDWEVKLGMQNGGNRNHTADEYARKFVDFYSFGKETGVRVTGDWFDPYATLFHTTRRLSDSQTQRLAPHSCSATDHQITVEPTGSVHPCRAMDMKLGEIDDLSGLLRSPGYKRLVMRTYSNVEECRDCPLEGFCQGVCLGNSEAVYGDIYSIDKSYCTVYHRCLDSLLAKVT